MNDFHDQFGRHRLVGPYLETLALAEILKTSIRDLAQAKNAMRSKAKKIGGVVFFYIAAERCAACCRGRKADGP